MLQAKFNNLTPDICTPDENAPIPTSQPGTIHPFNNPEILESALNVGNDRDTFSISTIAINQAVEELFPNGATTLSPEKYLEIISGNYSDFNLNLHGQTFTLSDLEMLTSHIPKASKFTQTSSPNDSSHELMIIGCGQGREAIPVIELSRLCGIERIIFNDILSGNIEQTRETIRAAYGDNQIIHGIKIDFLPGDACEIDPQTINSQDLILALWFVTSEIADFSSPENFTKKRIQFYQNIRKLLSRYGAFFEDVPYSSHHQLGRYYYQHAKTYNALQKRKILPGVNDQISVTNFSDTQKSGYPFLIRHINTPQENIQFMESQGLTNFSSQIRVMPSTKPTHSTTLQNLLATPQAILNLFSADDPKTIEAALRFHINTILLQPDTTDPTRFVRQTNIWTPGH